MRPPLGHAVHSDELMKLMRQLDRFDRELMPKETESGDTTRQRREDVALLADSLAASADDLPEVLDTVELSAEHREEFIGLALELERSALELAQAVRGVRGTDLSPHVEALHASCTACHDRFRVLPRVP